MYAEFSVVTIAKTLFSECETLIDNMVTGVLGPTYFNGGGVALDQTLANISHTNFSKCMSDSGGGLAQSGGGRVTLVDSFFDQCRAWSSGAYLLNGGHAFVTRVTFLRW